MERQLEPTENKIVAQCGFCLLPLEETSEAVFLEKNLLSYGNFGRFFSLWRIFCYGKTSCSTSENGQESQ